MNRNEQITHLLLKQEIEDFLYYEADLLDDRRYEEWLALVADDVRYWMPMRRNVKFGEEEREFTRAGQDINWFDEGKETLTRRVKQILTGIHWAEEPVSRISHMVSNIRLCRGQPLGGGAGRSYGQVPVSDLPQPGRDRDRHPRRQARGCAAPRRWPLADRAPQDRLGPECLADQEPDLLFLKYHNEAVRQINDFVIPAKSGIQEKA